MTYFRSTSVLATMLATVVGCATAPAPTTRVSVNRFYRDMATCYATARPDAIKSNRFTRWSNKTGVAPKETIIFTSASKTDQEFRVEFLEIPPETTSVTTIAVGKGISNNKAQAIAAPVIDACRQMPY